MRGSPAVETLGCDCLLSLPGVAKSGPLCPRRVANALNVKHLMATAAVTTARFDSDLTAVRLLIQGHLGHSDVIR